MYLTYIDESGKSERTDPEPEYVLASLTINESEWKDVDNRVRGLKQKYFPHAEQRPSNAVFISRLTEALLLEEE